MENSNIEWCHHTGNLWHGCVEVHLGCDNCYARIQNNRYHKEKPHWGARSPRLVIKKTFTDLLLFQRKAADLNEIHRVFVGSMMDIFEKPMPLVDGNGNEALDYSDGSPIETDHLRDLLFDNITKGLYPNLLFLLLTKRPGNINKYIPKSWKQMGAPNNVMFGTSVVDQETADKMIPRLLKVNGKRFLSCEPLLGEVDLRDYIFTKGDCPTCFGDGSIPANGAETFEEGGGGVQCPDCGWDLRKYSGGSPIHWVICGGESGSKARPMKPAWARSLRDQCIKAKVPFFFKQWGEWVSTSEVAGPGDHYSFPDGATVRRTGKKLAGSTLDGVEYKQFPTLNR